MMNLLSWTVYFILFYLNCYRIITACQEEDGFFQCSADKRCIEKHELCDSFEDCLDGEDETVGCQMKFNCTGPLKFLCADRKCIPAWFRCDGVTDCEDGSDEKNCAAGSPHCSLNREKYLCKYKYQCIDLNAVCDNKEDCEDHSDEGQACLEEIYPKTCRCDHCVRTPDGDVCICKEGYQSVNNTVCHDIDECSLLNVCDHNCTNIPGSYECSCYKTFELQADGRSCSKILKDDDVIKSINSMDYLYITSTAAKAVTPDSQVYSCNIEVAEKLDITPLGRNYFATVVTYANDTKKMVQMLAELDRDIGFFDIELSSLQVQKICNIFSHVVADYYTTNIYFVCKQMGIVVCARNLDTCSLIRAHKSKTTIKSIALSPPHGLMFWLETARESDVVRIMRSSMSGANETVLLSENLASNYGQHTIVADSDDKRVYYFNVRGARIESLMFDGTRRQVIKTGVFQPLALGVLQHQLLWSTNHSNQIFACNKYNGKNTVSVVSDQSPIQSIIVNPCREMEISMCINNACSDLCLLTSEETRHGPVAKTTCACPYNVSTTLAMDGISCLGTTIVAGNITRESNNSLFIVGQAFSSQPKITRIELKNIGVMSSITYDPITGRVFFFELEKSILYTYHLKRRKLSIVSFEIGTVTSMVYDGLSNNIYLCNSKTQAIEVLSLTTSRKATLISNSTEERPVSFSLASKQGIMFVEFRKHVANSSSSLEIVSLSDTTERRVFESGDLIDLVADESTNYLYWGWKNTPQTLLGVPYSNHSGLDGETMFFIIDDPLVDLHSVDGKILFSSSGSARVHWLDTKSSVTPKYDYLDLVAEEGSYLLDSRLLLAPITVVNTSSPCFLNNGNCEHVCLVVNGTAYHKRCLCESPYTLAEDGHRCFVKEKKIVEEAMAKPKATRPSIYTFIFFALLTSIVVAVFLFIYNRTNLGDYFFRIPLTVVGARSSSRTESVSNIRIIDSDDF